MRHMLHRDDSKGSSMLIRSRRCDSRLMEISWRLLSRESDYSSSCDLIEIFSVRFSRNHSLAPNPH